MSIFGDNKAVERLDDRLAKVEFLCSDLERQNRKLELEYIELFDKVKRQMSRMAKRYAVDQKENGELLEPAPLDDGIDPISRAILDRRGATRKK